MNIEFNESLITGNELIDTQHRELIERVNKLTEDCAAGKEKNSAIRTLDFLMDYVDFHFSAEEKLQEENSYPLLDAHKKQHEHSRGLWIHCVRCWRKKKGQATLS